MRKWVAIVAAAAAFACANPPPEKQWRHPDPNMRSDQQLAKHQLACAERAQRQMGSACDSEGDVQRCSPARPYVDEQIFILCMRTFGWQYTEEN